MVLHAISLDACAAANFSCRPYTMEEPHTRPPSHEPRSKRSWNWLYNSVQYFATLSTQAPPTPRLHTQYSHEPKSEARVPDVGLRVLLFAPGRMSLQHAQHNDAHDYKTQ